MPWVQEFTSSTAGATNTLNVSVPAAGIPAGHTVALGIASSATGGTPTWTITDTASNTWTIDPTYGSYSVSSNGGITLATCVVTTALTAADTITISASAASVQRMAVEFEEFSETITGLDTGSGDNNGGATDLTPTSGSFTTTQPVELLIGAIDIVSPGRTYTPSGSWTGGTQVQSTNGTGDRAVMVQWRYVTSTGTYAASGSYNVAASYAMLGVGYTYAAGGYFPIWNITSF